MTLLTLVHLVHSPRPNLLSQLISVYWGHTMALLTDSQVQEVSHDSKMAKLVRSDVNWITEPRYLQARLVLRDVVLTSCAQGFHER